MPFRIVPLDSADFGRCACCGNSSRQVRGEALRESGEAGFYSVHWTLGHVEQYGANFDLIFGYGETGGGRLRMAASLFYRCLDTGPSFMVIDAADRPHARMPAVGRILRRDDVIGRPVAAEIFAFADAILEQDARIEELLCGRTLL